LSKEKEFEELRKEIRKGIIIYVVFWFLMVILILSVIYLIFKR